MKKSKKTALGECFPRAFAILLHIFIFLDIADADIADAMDKILKGLAEELGAQLRDK